MPYDFRKILGGDADIEGIKLLREDDEDVFGDVPGMEFPTLNLNCFGHKLFRAAASSYSVECSESFR